LIGFSIRFIFGRLVASSSCGCIGLCLFDFSGNDHPARIEFTENEHLAVVDSSC